LDCTAKTRSPLICGGKCEQLRYVQAVKFSGPMLPSSCSVYGEVPDVRCAHHIHDICDPDDSVFDLALLLVSSLLFQTFCWRTDFSNTLSAKARRTSPYTTKGAIAWLCSIDRIRDALFLFLILKARSQDKNRCKADVTYTWGEALKALEILYLRSTTIKSG
jgi:hypothetical protein